MRSWFRKTFSAGLLMTIIASFLLVFVPQPALAQTDEDVCKVTDTSKAITLNIQIPGITYELPKGSGNYYIKNLGCYIIGIYRYFATVAGILATVMMMYAGVKYVISFGNQQKISEAKDTITGAMVGLALVLGSYLILYFINPNLTKFELLVSTIAPVEDFCEDYISRGMTVDPPLPQRECGTPGIITSENELKGGQCFYRGTECEEYDMECVLNVFNDEYECKAEWEGMRFCSDKVYVICSQPWDKNGKNECTGVHTGKEGTICVATSDESEKGVEIYESLPIFYIDKIYEAYISTENIECGYISKKWLINDKLVVGKKCDDDKKSCLILFGGEEQYGYRIYQPGDMKPKDPDLIGVFPGKRCY